MSLKTYTIERTYSCVDQIEVEAENDEDALDIARSAAPEDYYNVYVDEEEYDIIEIDDPDDYYQIKDKTFGVVSIRKEHFDPEKDELVDDSD